MNYFSDFLNFKVYNMIFEIWYNYLVFIGKKLENLIRKLIVYFIRLVV